MKAYFSLPTLAIAAGAFLAFAPSSSASAESYDEYLSRLRDICASDCLEPRAFQRAARKRDSSEAGDMALIMDVVEVRRVGDTYQLLSMNLEIAPLDEVELLGSAGIDTSGRTGVGGLSRGRGDGLHPNLIIIEFDEQTFFDTLNPASPLVEADIRRELEADIVVEGTREREGTRPSFTLLRSHYRNRRVVVRGQVRLTPAFVGARRDFRRKQVTLEVASAADIAMLPRYDEDGEPILTGEFGG